MLDWPRLRQASLACPSQAGCGSAVSAASVEHLQAEGLPESSRGQVRRKRTPPPVRPPNHSDPERAVQSVRVTWRGLLKNHRGRRRFRSLVCHHEITPTNANPREWTPIRVHSRGLAAPLTNITSPVQTRNAWPTCGKASFHHRHLARHCREYR